ncbi:RepB family plasmid replication initiator protein [Sphingomonas sp. SFZ2018-12]|uniref:replication initiator protein A n=1 Tax=Sphingomonas sp. SFZ2018-12 TaxID=2683197 RepID=UPI001F0E53AD|nr:replication initiator protein A [Sphingomonas sp. SFZ2018-12]MCH4894966.1 RepB family plasmid replication initiator protein [Sphingomonas sp. SFZ2018-12]
MPAKQGDLFVLDSPLLADVRGERSLMAFPFFALSKGKWTKPLSYENGSVSIEIVPTSKGAATIYDKEIVLYIASLMIARLEAGGEVSQEFHFTAHDLFCVTGNNPSARSYTRLSQALERLQGTQIKTNIEAGGEGEEGYFSWLSEAKLYYSRTKEDGGETRRLKAIRVRLCDWLYRAILRDRQILDYASGYFQLGPVERRLYEIARSSCTDGPVEIELDELRRQLGYQNSLPHFRHVLKGIVEADAIPDFRLGLIGPEPATPGGRVPSYNRVRIEAKARLLAN